MTTTSGLFGLLPASSGASAAGLTPSLSANQRTSSSGTLSGNSGSVQDGAFFSSFLQMLFGSIRTPFEEARSSEPTGTDEAIIAPSVRTVNQPESMLAESIRALTSLANGKSQPQTEQWKQAVQQCSMQMNLPVPTLPAVPTIVEVTGEANNSAEPMEGEAAPVTAVAAEPLLEQTDAAKTIITLAQDPAAVTAAAQQQNKQQRSASESTKNVPAAAGVSTPLNGIIMSEAQGTATQTAKPKPAEQSVARASFAADRLPVPPRMLHPESVPTENSVMPQVSDQNPDMRSSSPVTPDMITGKGETERRQGSIDASHIPVKQDDLQEPLQSLSNFRNEAAPVKPHPISSYPPKDHMSAAPAVITSVFTGPSEKEPAAPQNQPDVNTAALHQPKGIRPEKKPEVRSMKNGGSTAEQPMIVSYDDRSEETPIVQPTQNREYSSEQRSASSDQRQIASAPQNGEMMHSKPAERTEFRSVMTEAAPPPADVKGGAPVTKSVMPETERPAPQQLFEQLSKGIVVAVREQRSEMKITLRPESLGEVTVRVRVEEGKVSTSMDVQQVQVKQTIEANIPQLREALSAKGLTMERIEVSTPQQEFSGRSGHGQQGEGKRKGHDPFERVLEEDEAVKMFGYNTMEVTM